MPKQKIWTIRVGEKALIRAEFQVPVHKLETKGMETFLRAIVIRYCTDTPEEMLRYYVNRRKGAPDRLCFADVQYFLEPERKRSGYFCGDWECYAMATLPLTEEEAEGLKVIIEENRAASRLEE